MYIRDWSIRNARWPKNRCDILRVCPREDQADVTHAISPICLKLSHMIKHGAIL